MTDALVLRQRIAPGEADAVRELVAEQPADRAGAGIGGLVRAEGVHTASLFLDRRDEDEPSLVWYVEVEDASSGPWADPVRTLLRNAPLFDAGLGDLLETPDSARVVSDASTAADVVVHAALPGRPSSVGSRTEGSPSSLSLGEDERTSENPGQPPDVVLLRLRIEPRFGEWFVRALAGLTNRLEDEGRIERKFDEWTRPVLEDEGMWTETIFLERTDGNYYLLWYMEAEDMARVYDAYFESANPIARISEPVLGTILADPGRALSNPLEKSDYELLVHAVNADRP